MSFGKIGILLSKIFTAAQSIEPTGSGLVIFEKLGWVLTWIWEGICLGIYNIIRWLLALVDFMQYFVQKLIGLDYWLNRTYYTMEGAIESDLIFGFLYNDTVQKVFRAMMGIFFVLLIIFTIYAIIKSEWDHINGTGKGGKFGDGTGNSKSKIFKNSIKAIALVLIFPIILMVGIISANAILASLIKALNIDTSSTLGGQLFQIASQNANKYEKYAHDTDGRTAVSDEVTFYVKNNKYITLGSGGSSDVVTLVDTYEDYLKQVAGATKYTVKSCFDRIGGVFDDGYDKKNFYGYIARLTVEGEPFFIMATCNKDGGTNSKEAMYYYLKCVLQVPIVNKYDSYGFGGHSIVKEYMNGDPDWGYISGMNLNETGFDDVEQAMRNTWNYASIYKETYAFEDALDYVVTRRGGVSLSNTEMTNASGTSGSSLLEKTGLGVNSAKVMINSPLVSAYFDGGERGIVQLQSEYLVMAEVIDFINQNNFRLHILDINSDLIDWNGEGSYRVESKWVNKNGVTVTDGSGQTKTSIPFIVSYSDSCNETEMGNVLYFGDDVGGEQSELKGAKYIMCIKVEGKSNAKYVPLVNNKTFTDPVTGKMYNFKSSYYSSSYQGVVLAKGLLDSSATNAYRGEPTYFQSSTKTKGTLFNPDGSYVGKDEPYYYEMEISGGFNQYAENGDISTSYGTNGYKMKFDGASISLSGQNFYYDMRRTDTSGGGGTPVYDKQTFNIYKVITDDAVAESERESIADPSADMIRSMQINLVKDNADTDEIVTAEYAGQSSGDYHLFKFSYSGSAYYFMVYLNAGEKTVSILSVDNAGQNWSVLNYNSAETYGGHILNAITKRYIVKYDFDQGSNKAYKQSLSADGFTPDYFDYSKTVTKKLPSSDTYSTKTIYQTVDMESISVGSVNKTLYFNICFDTASKYLVTIENGNVKFANVYEPATQTADNAGMVARSSDPFVQSSSFFKFFLYDFYHAYVGGSTIKTYNPENGNISNASRPSEEDDDWFFECKVDADDFSFPAKESYLHLYDGSRYVATIYKVSGNDASYAIGTVGQLATATTYILYNDTNYYNIKTQNAYSDDAGMTGYFEDVKQSMVIRCVRDNRSMVFFDFDFYFVSLIPSLKIRNNIGFFSEKLDREWIGQEFYITDGIQFDYFFEGKASLITFYIPSKISYWIILVASALMIKVLGTAIWGVIKRIYEITLFFIAAPAVASTIPLDDGQKFTTQIQQPLVRKVLGTYGTMLGINVFFILLYPVKSLSQIFTPEDIATSNSYFLKNFFSIFGREFQAKMLNLYVYILFVLVAFTMISALPGIIAQMLGAEDVHKNGEQTKKQAASDVKGAMDHVSGKNLMEGGKKAWEGAKNSLPGKALGLGIKGAKGLKNKFSKGVPDDDGGDEEPKEEPKSRTDEEMAEDDAAVQGQFDSKFNEMAGDKFGGKSYQEVMENGTEEEKQQATEIMNQAQAAVGAEIKAGGDANQQAAFDRLTAATEEEGEKTPEDAAEAAAQAQFEGSTAEIAQMVVGESGDAAQMEANAMVNMAGTNGVANKVVAAAAGAVAGADGKTDLTAQTFGNDAAGQERKKQAVLSTMNEQERASFEKMNAKQQEAVLNQYDVSSTMDADGNVSMAVTHARDAKGNAIAGAEATAVGADTAASVMNSVAKETADKDPAAFAAAMDSTEGAHDTAQKAVASNIATAIDFGAAGSETGDSVAEMIINDITENPTEGQNGAIIDNAMLAFLQDPANKKILKEFQKLTGLSDADMQNQDLVLKNISTLRAGGTGIQQLGITADSYKDKMGGAIEQAVQKGEYSISAWELFKKTDPNASEYIDKVSAENNVRNNDEVALETEKSADNLEAMIQALIEKLLQGVDFEANAKAEYEKEKGAGSWDKLDKEKQQELTAQNEAKTKEQAEAQARGQMLFNAFAQNADGNSAAVNQMFAAAMGITPDNQGAIISGVFSGEQQANLQNAGFGQDQIAQAIKAIELMGGKADFESVSQYLREEKENPDAHSQKLLEAMQNDTTGAVNKDVMYQMLGGNDILDESQKEKLAEQTAANGMLTLDAATQKQVTEAIAKEDYEKEHGAGSWDKLDQTKKDELLQKAGEKANGMSLYEIQAIASGKSQKEVFTELREESKKRKVIDEALASNPDIPVEQLIETAGNDPEAVKYIQEMYAQRMSAVTDADRAEAQDAAEADVIKEKTKGPDGKGKGADINTEAGRKEAYRQMVGGDAAEADAKLNAEVESKFNAHIKDQINANPELKAERDAWLAANPTKTQDDFVAHMAAKAKAGDAAALKSLGFVDAHGNADATKVTELTAKFEKEVVVGMAKETYDGFDADVAENASKRVEAKNRDLIESGRGAEILKTAEILDKGNASGTYAKFINEANQEYMRLYGKDKNLAKEDPLARAAFLSQYMQKRGFTLEADDAHTVKKAGEEAKATGKAAGDKAVAEFVAKNPIATPAQIAKVRQEAAIFAQVTANPEQFSEMMSVMESYDGGEKGNAVALKLKRKVLTDTYDNYAKQGIKLSIAKDPEKMDAKERKRFDFNKGILQQEMRTNNDVVGNLFKNTNLFNQEAMIQAIAQSSGMKFDENIGAWVDAEGKVLKDENGQNIGNDNIIALKSKLDNTAIANYMNSHEDAKDKLLNLGAQNMMLTMNKETQDIKKADAVLSSTYLRNEVSTKVLKDAGLQDGNGNLDKDAVKELIKQMLKASGRDAEATDENINKNFEQYKTELSLHAITKDANGNFAVGGRDANAFVKATADLEGSSSKFATALNREVTRVIDPANYDPETSTREFFASHSISDFRADDGSEIHNLADALNAFNKEGFGGFKKGAKNIVGDAKGGMTSGGIVGGFKTMFLGGYGEGNKHGGVVGNDAERGGIVGGLESIAVKGVLGSARNLITLKGIRAASKAIKESKQVKLDNGQDISYIKYKTGGYELDENGKVKRDERGNAILVKKKKLSGAEEQFAKAEYAKDQYAKEQYAREQYDAVHGAGEFDKLDADKKKEQTEHFAAQVGHAQTSYAKEQYARENYAKEQYAKEKFDKMADASGLVGGLSFQEYYLMYGKTLTKGFSASDVATYSAKFTASNIEQYSAGFNENDTDSIKKYSAGFNAATETKKYATEFNALDDEKKKKYSTNFARIVGSDAKYTAGFNVSKVEEYSAGFDTASSTLKEEYATGFKKLSKSQKETHARQSAVEKRAKETFAQDEYAKEQYAKEHGTTEGFDKLSAAEKSQYTAGFAKLSKEDKAKYAANFDTETFAVKLKYMSDANRNVTSDEIAAAGKAERNADYVSGFKRFKKVSNAVLDNTAIGTLLKQPLIGVAKMGTGIGLGVGKIGAGIGLGTARMATKAWTSTVGNLHSFVTRGDRLFKGNNTEMLEMVQEARKDKLIMREVGENASTEDIAKYLDREKVAGNNIRNRVHARKARELANTDATFADEMIKAGVDMTDDAAIAEHLSKNKAHRNKVEQEFKKSNNNADFANIVQNDSRMNAEVKQQTYSTTELENRIKAKQVEVDVTDEEIAAEALKNSYIKSVLGPNASMQDVKAYLDSHQDDKDKFTLAAQVKAIRSGREGKVRDVTGKMEHFDNVLDKMLLSDGKATKVGANGPVIATEATVKNHFDNVYEASKEDTKVFKKAKENAKAAIKNTFKSAGGTIVRGSTKAWGATKEGVTTFFAGKKISDDFEGVSMSKVKAEDAYAKYKYGEMQYAAEEYSKSRYAQEQYDAIYGAGKFGKLSAAKKKEQIEQYSKEFKKLDSAQRAKYSIVLNDDEYIRYMKGAGLDYSKVSAAERVSYEQRYDDLTSTQKTKYKNIAANAKKSKDSNHKDYLKFRGQYGNQAYYDTMSQKDKQKIESMTVESFTAGKHKKGLIDDKTKQKIMQNMVGGSAAFAKLSAAEKKTLEAKYNKLTVAEARKLSGDNETFNKSVAQYARLAGTGTREGFTQSYLAKGTMAALKGAGKGIWAGIKSPVSGFARTFVGGEKDSMGKRHWGESGLAKLGKGIGHGAVVGYNAVIFKTAKGLPKMCTQYVNWNKVLEHKIQAVKRDTTLTREQKEKQIKIYESQKIYLNKPAAYNNMSADEQNAFDLEQDKLRRQAFTDPALASFVKRMERAERAGNPAAVGLPGEMGYAGAPSRSRKEKHLHDFNEGRSLADRFRATAAMRNRERDYGDDFEKFARTFMSRKRYFDMIKRYKLKTAIQYQMLTADQKERERRKREEAMNAQISRINRILAKKVAKDNKVSVNSYLVSRGMSPDVARFKDGSIRYRDIQNAIPKTGLGSRSRQVSEGARSNAEILQIQNQTININNMMNEFIKFSSTFKGTSTQFAEAFKKEFAKFGPYAQKIYDKYASSFKRLGKNIIGMDTSLDRTPIAVQQRKIMEGLAQELSKCKRRITMDGKIPASQEINNMFVGKTFTGATTQAELALHKQEADELSRLLKLVKDQRNHVSYESLTQRLAGIHLSDFMRKNPKINNLSEEAKKNKLEQYFKARLDKALKVVHNDSAHVADKHNLERLNGRRVKRSEIDHSRHSRTMSDAMRTQDNPVYQSLVRESNSTTEKHKLEKTNLDDLLAMLRKMQMMPRTPRNINEIVKIEKAINVSRVKLKTLETLMKNAQKRKRDYEQAFASTQIREAKASTRVLAYNSSVSVLDRYSFPTTAGKEIVKGSVEAKEVQMLVNRYISQYKQTIQSMINNTTIQANSELKRYVEGMKRKFTSDFGRNMKYTKDIKAELTRQIERIALQGAKGDKKLLSDLQDFVRQFNMSNESLELEMKKLGINISGIKLKK